MKSKEMWIVKVDKHTYRVFINKPMYSRSAKYWDATGPRHTMCDLNFERFTGFRLKVGQIFKVTLQGGFVK